MLCLFFIKEVNKRLFNMKMNLITEQHMQNPEPTGFQPVGACSLTSNEMEIRPEDIRRFSVWNLSKAQDEKTEGQRM